MNTVTIPGYGDAATWSPCDGHPHDPRTPEVSDQLSDAQEVCEEIRLWLGIADSALKRGDLPQFAAAMETMQQYLDDLSFHGIPI